MIWLARLATIAIIMALLHRAGIDVSAAEWWLWMAGFSVAESFLEAFAKLRV